jgi:hypothetical protein
VALIEVGVYGKRRGRGEISATTGRRKRRVMENMWLS